MEISLPSFAKINLALRVLGKRSDGYHELTTLFQSLEFHDSLTFRFSPGEFGISIKVAGAEVPTDARNLIHKACIAFNRAHKIDFRIEASVSKQIPVESGLGGGSSNAAATLVAISRFLHWPLKMVELSSVAATIGADVPYFLHGGTALGEGRGDQITPLEDWPSAQVLLVHPSVTCSTTAIYRYYDEWNLLTDPANSIKIHLDQRPESLTDFVSRIENDLEKVVFALYPELESIKNKLKDSGAMAAGLTGSGSVIFGLFEKAEDADRAVSGFAGSIRTRFLSRNEYQRALVPDR
jgi:4-diphosphocytidyl-2-C-methyl-D-erythritol kinase